MVEDEHKIARSIKQGLEQEKYAVDVAYDGQDGYGLAITEEYDLIILDRMLPGMDGLEICKNLRKEKIHVPILMLTAKGEIDDKVVGLDAGADDYLAKPFAFAELIARIRALSRRPSAANGVQLQVADLTLNPVTFEVKRAEKHLSLSSKEFALLHYLMRHPNQILTKDQIIAHVWDYDAEVLPNTVEVYIKHLREKIDKPFNRPFLIQTIRGFGYKIGEVNV